MFREMEYALKLTRGFYKEYFPPVEILKMATVNAGQALNLNLGCIQEGMLADIMMVELLSDNPIPVSYTHLDVYKRQLSRWGRPPPLSSGGAR